MASEVSLHTQATLDGTTINGDIKVTRIARTADTVTFRLETTTWFESASGYSGAGYETYTGTLVLSGSGISETKVITLKALSEEWSGTTHHTTSGDYVFSISTSSDVVINLTYTVRSSQDSSHKGEATGTINAGQGAIVPTKPTSCTATSATSGSTSYFYIGYNADTKINLTAAGGSNVDHYGYEVKIGSGTWTAVSGSSYTPSSPAAGTLIYFRAYSVSSTGNTAGYATSGTITVRYRTPSAPTGLTLSTVAPTYKDTLTLSWTAPAQTVSGYKVKYRINGGAWSAETTRSVKNFTFPDISALKFRDEVEFSVVAYNASASSSAATSGKAKLAGGMMLKVSGAWKPGTVYIKVGGVWKLAVVKRKVSGVWKVSV